MKRAILSLVSVALICASGATYAQAEQFGLNGLDVTFTAADGSSSMQAGSHPFAFTTKLAVNTETVPGLGELPAGQAKDLRITLPPGVVGAPTATPRCSGVDFATQVFIVSGLNLPNCSDSSVVGLAAAKAATPSGVPVEVRAPVYNLVPPPGQVAKFGFVVIGAAPVTFTAGIEETFPYHPFVSVLNIPQMVRFFSSEVVIWGNPSSEEHAKQRGKCGAFFKQGGVVGELGGECPTSNPDRPFLTLPRSCSGPLVTSFEAISWLGETFAQGIETHDSSDNPLGVEGCERLGFGPKLSAEPTSHSASSPSGLDVDVDVDDPGVNSPEGLANSDIQKAVLTLPEGMTANPSQAEGLGVCSEADFKRETAESAFGAGCPGSSKIGTVEAESPLLEGEIFKGSVFVATPYKNPSGTLLALYMVVKDPALGINVKLPIKVAPDPATGQLVATVDDIPQVPVSHFHFHFREGGRSPLITPPACGTYTSQATLTPSGSPTNPLTTTSSFKITSGVGGGLCPPAGPPPFKPGFTAGAINNAAGDYSPFYLRLTRRDGDQDLTRFAATLPPGVLGKLAGVSRCPETEIALAKTKSGTAELASPSCPANSKIGRLLTGVGVGSQLTHVPGAIYLAGPYNGAPLSVVAVVPAVAGPFDVGTVLVRQALTLNPRTGVVEVDGERSDPIPHILAGIVLKVREVEVFVERPNFTLNPTSCDPSQTKATLLGSFADVFNPADDVAVALSDRFQAAGCASLGFKPRLALTLKGATERGGHPALHAVYRPRPGEANLEGLTLRLPHSAFLEQAHIRTICTRVQFAAKNCPPGAIYGRVRAFTPLLEQPLEGPAYLRSSDNPLPDLVFDLRGVVDIESAAKVDSVNGGIRVSFQGIPDAPLSKVVVDMQGAKKGLIVNSADLCAAPNRANVQLRGHNGKRSTAKPVLRATGCGKQSRRGSGHRPGLR